MKVFGICGSPRKEGNTDILLDKALQGARDAGACTNKVVIQDLSIAPVSEAEYEDVDSRGFSPVKDDMSIIYDGILESDIIILASPIFFGTLSTQSKMMIDRFQCVWVAKYMKNQDVYTRKIKGPFLCVEATAREDFFDNARSIVKHFFATVNAEYSGEVLCPGVDKKGSIQDKEDVLLKAYELGKKLTVG